MSGTVLRTSTVLSQVLTAILCTINCYSLFKEEESGIHSGEITSLM